MLHGIILFTRFDRPDRFARNKYFFRNSERDSFAKAFQCFGKCLFMIQGHSLTLLTFSVVVKNFFSLRTKIKVYDLLLSALTSPLII